MPAGDRVSCDRSERWQANPMSRQPGISVTEMDSSMEIARRRQSRARKADGRQATTIWTNLLLHRERVMGTEAAALCLGIESAACAAGRSSHPSGVSDPGGSLPRTYLRRPPRPMPPRRLFVRSSKTMSMVRPLICVPRRDSMATLAESSSDISMYPNPLGRPRRSLTTLAETTLPNSENAVLRSTSVVSCARLPTYSVFSWHPPC